MQTVYSIDVGTASTERLEIRNGDVTFTNASYTVGATDLVPAGTVLDNSVLTLAGGSLSGIHLLIGESAAARVNVKPPGLLVYSGSLQVGGPGNGILNIEEGIVASGEGRIGNGVGGGLATLTGGTASWNTGNFSVGHSGNGTLTISDGGTVTSGEGFVGFGNDTTGEVTIQGSGFAGGTVVASTWKLNQGLTIGLEGTGSVEVLDSAILEVLGETTVNGTLSIAGGAVSVHSSQPVTIGGFAAGVVSVAGFGAALPTRMNAISDLTVGESAGGALVVEDGGSVACDNLFIGDFAFGSVEIAGVNQAPSSLVVSNQLNVGNSGVGFLTIHDGAQVTADSVTAGAQAGSNGNITLLGTSASNPTLLTATLGINLPSLGGTGTLTIGENAKLTCGFANVGFFNGAVGEANLGFKDASGTPAQWIVNDFLILGGVSGPGTITLHNGANVAIAHTLYIQANGHIGGTGTYSAEEVLLGFFDPPPKTSLAEAVPGSALITPGDPIGTLVIEGDYEQTAIGKLSIETNGLADGEFDVLHITGAATFGGTLEMLFPGSYLPKTGDSFQFLEVDGVISGEFAEVTFPQLLPGFQFDMTQTPGGMVLTALNDAVLAPTFLLNISTRLQVGTDENVLIGGFILSGTEPKQVLIRAVGPSLETLGVNGALADPTLELHDITGALIGQNDNWRTTQTGGLITEDQFLAIHATNLPPSNDAESAIIATLDPGAYTAILAGANSSTGIGLVEVYDLGPAPAAAKLANISTRGLVQTGDNVMIGGLIVGNQTSSVLVRGIGPSLGAAGVNGALADPTLELRDVNGVLIASNDNWRSDQEAEIEATGLPPNDDLESALLRSLDPGAYTAILRGVGDTTGVGLVEAYNLD